MYVSGVLHYRTYQIERCFLISGSVGIKCSQAICSDQQNKVCADCYKNNDDYIFLVPTLCK